MGEQWISREWLDADDALKQIANCGDSCLWGQVARAAMLPREEVNDVN